MKGRARAWGRSPGAGGPAGGAPAPGERLRALVQQLFRSSGVLSSGRTPCGKPLAVSHAHALMLLLEHDRRGQQPTQQDLGTQLGIDKSNVARLCQKMERAGHLSQERSPRDGRARLLSLTERGRRLAAEVERASRTRFERLCHAIPAARRSLVLSALALLNDALASSRETVTARGPRAARRRSTGPARSREGGSP